MKNLIQKLNLYGLDIDGEPILDGNIHRCKHNNSKDKRGWYVGHVLSHDKIYCTYGSFDDKSYKYFNNQNDINSEDLVIIKKIAIAKKKEKELLHKKAASKAKGILNVLKKATKNHKYIQVKNIQPHGAFIKKDALVIPIVNKDKNITSYQEIFPDGSKKLLYGGKKQGCFQIIDGEQNEAIAICEGWATGCSINEAIGCMVLASIDVHNIENVLKIVIEKLPGRKIYLCCDNDHKKKQNIGLEKGKSLKKKYPFINLRYPDDIEGSDFNDLMNEKDLDAVKSNILQEPILFTEKDFKNQECLSINLEDDLLFPGGLIDLGMKACKNSYITNIDQYNFPVILSIIANSISGKIKFYNNVWPNLYNIKVGGTSTGKTDSDKFWKTAIKNYGIQDFYGATDFASGPGLFRGLALNPQSLMCLDEISYLFKRFDKPDAVSSSKISALLELHTNAGQEIKKPYGDDKKNLIIDYPCLNIIGNATPTIFNDIRPDDFESGLIQRFDFWMYDGKIPYRTKKINQNNDYIDLFLKCLYMLNTARIEIKQQNLVNIFGDAISIFPDNECQELLEKFSMTNTDDSNAQDDIGKIGIVSRRYNAAIKYALIHLASKRILAIVNREKSINHLADPMEIDSLEYGIKLATKQAGWKLNILSGRVNTGDFHRDCKIFIEAIKACLQAKRPLTGKSLADRRPIIKSWQPKYFKDVARALSARKEILIDDKKKQTRYLLIKD